MMKRQDSEQTTGKECLQSIHGHLGVQNHKRKYRGKLKNETVLYTGNRLFEMEVGEDENLNTYRKIGMKLALKL